MYGHGYEMNTVKVASLRVGEYSRSVGRRKKMTCHLHIFLFSCFLWGIFTVVFVVVDSLQILCMLELLSVLNVKKRIS